VDAVAPAKGALQCEQTSLLTPPSPDTPLPQVGTTTAFDLPIDMHGCVRQHETGPTASAERRVDRGADMGAALDTAQTQAAQLEKVLAASSSEKACAPGSRP
jgi:hypothetical protein